MPPKNSGYGWSDTPLHGSSPASERDEWTLYAWGSRRMQWMSQDEYTNVSLEAALTAALKWKSEGQTVRLESGTF